jgi:hypothetical protein
MAIRYAANGMPMVEKKVPKPVVDEAPKPAVEQPKEENVKILNDDVEEGNVSEDNE